MIAAPRHPDFQPTVGKLGRPQEAAKGVTSAFGDRSQAVWAGAPVAPPFSSLEQPLPPRCSRAVWEETIPRHDRARMRHDDAVAGLNSSS
jgi:hypothetical protein